jgi:CheY-like chemotaxis protein
MLSREVSYIDGVVATKEKPNISANTSINNSLPCNRVPIDNNHGRYILIVDDEYDVVELIRRLFERDGFQTCIFTNPLAALVHFNSSIEDNYYYQHCHPVIISDIRMPAMNGYEFTKHVKRLDANAKIILMSTLPAEDNEFFNTLPKIKIDQFIQKPFSGSKLVGIVKTYVKSNLCLNA